MKPENEFFLVLFGHIALIMIAFFFGVYVGGKL